MTGIKQKTKLMKSGWVYILECSDGSYYTGVTSDLDVRIAEHQNGIHKGYTYFRRPVRLLWSDCFPEMEQAIGMEKRIKGWTRKKKEALMAGNFDLLQELSKTANYKNQSQIQSSTGSN
jgi:predicted GIY-YIG superfamily endonuclease